MEFFGDRDSRITMACMSRVTIRLLVLAGSLALGACGFQLRGAVSLPFETLHVQAPATSQFATQLKRAVTTGGQTRILDNPREAQFTLQVVNELREKSILSLSSGGRVREYQLLYRVSYRMHDRELKEVLAPAEIVLRRDFSFNDRETLSKEAEEALLFRDMQNDAVQQLVRRLQATKLAARS